MIRISCYDSSGEALDELYQWDSNVTVVAKGLGDKNVQNLQFHFANRRSQVAYVVTPEKNEDGVFSLIPNELLLTPDAINLFVYEITPNGGQMRTISEIRMPVAPRQKPDEFEYVPNITIKKVADGLSVVDGKIYLSSNGVIFGNGVSVGSSERFSSSDIAISHGDIMADIFAIATQEGE